jgi:hypothetical protein
MIMAKERKQIYEYDFEGNFIKAYNISGNHSHFSSFNDLFLFEDQSQSTDNGNVLLITNRDGQTINDTISITAEGTIYGKDKIQIYDEYALFLPTQSDVIYKIDPSGRVSTAYSFDFGRYWLDAEESSEVAANSNGDAFALWKYMQRTDKVGFLRFLDTQDWLFLNFEKQDRSYNWYYNKHTQNQYMTDLKAAAGNTVEACNIIGIEQGRFIAAVPAYSYSRLKDVQPMNISEEDNPVLVTFDIKEEKK